MSHAVHLNQRIRKELSSRQSFASKDLSERTTHPIERSSYNRRPEEERIALQKLITSIIGANKVGGTGHKTRLHYPFQKPAHHKSRIALRHALAHDTNPPKEHHNRQRSRAQGLEQDCGRNPKGYVGDDEDLERDVVPVAREVEGRHHAADFGVGDVSPVDESDEEEEPEEWDQGEVEFAKDAAFDGLGQRCGR